MFWLIKVFVVGLLAWHLLGFQLELISIVIYIYRYGAGDLNTLF